jgi:hypothetical protein
VSENGEANSRRRLGDPFQVPTCYALALPHSAPSLHPPDSILDWQGYLTYGSKIMI